MCRLRPKQLLRSSRSFGLTGPKASSFFRSTCHFMAASSRAPKYIQLISIVHGVVVFLPHRQQPQAPLLSSQTIRACSKVYGKKIHFSKKVNFLFFPSFNHVQGPEFGSDAWAINHRHVSVTPMVATWAMMLEANVVFPKPSTIARVLPDVSETTQDQPQAQEGDASSPEADLGTMADG